MWGEVDAYAALTQLDFADFLRIRWEHAYTTRFVQGFKSYYYQGRAKPHGAATSQTSFGHTVCHRLDATAHHQASWTPPRVQEFLSSMDLFCVGIYEQSGSLSEVQIFTPVLAKGFGFGSHVG